MTQEEKKKKHALESKLYRERHKLKIRQKRLIYERLHEEELRQRRKISYLKNRDKILEKGKIYSRINSEKIKQRLKIRDEKYFLETGKTRYQRYKLQLLNADNKRRALEANSDVTTEWLSELWQRTTHCEICSKELEDSSNYPNGKELDHIVPIGIGGRHKKDNLRYLCGYCNRSRPKDGRDLINRKAV